MSLGNAPTKWNQHCRIPVLYGGLIVNDFLTIYIYIDITQIISLCGIMLV